jgi:hypothetical protein
LIPYGQSTYDIRTCLDWTDRQADTTVAEGVQKECIPFSDPNPVLVDNNKQHSMLRKECSSFWLTNNNRNIQHLPHQQKGKTSKELAMRIENNGLWLPVALVTSYLVTGIHGFGVVAPAASMSYTSGRRAAVLVKSAVTPDIPDHNYWNTLDMLPDMQDEARQGGTRKKLGIHLGPQLNKMSSQDELDLKAEVENAISAIVDAGMKEMVLLSDRLKRDNANPHDLVRVKWNRAYDHEEMVLRVKLDQLAKDFLNDTREQRAKVHASALESSLLAQQEGGFSRRADAASHGREYSPSSEDISHNTARLLVRAKKALQGLLLDTQGGSWNEWDEWEGDFSSNTAKNPKKGN